MDVVHFNVFSQPDIDSIIAVELLELKESNASIGRIESKRLVGLVEVKSLHHLLFQKVAPYLLGFPITWLVEVEFSAANDVLTEKRNL